MVIIVAELPKLSQK